MTNPIKNPLPPLSTEVLEALNKLKKADGNTEVKQRVFIALATGQDIDVSSDTKKMQGYLAKALSSYQEKYRLLQSLLSDHPVKRGNTDYVEQVFKIYRRAPTNKAKCALIDIYAHGLPQSDASVRHSIAQPNLSRNCKTFEEMEAIIDSLKKLST